MTSLTDENEAAAVAAMFKATSENWEQTQEKMSQFVFFHTSMSTIRIIKIIN